MCALINAHPWFFTLWLLMVCLMVEEVARAIAKGNKK